MVTWALPCQNNAPLRLWTPSPWRMLSLNEPTKWMAFVVTSSPCPVRTPRLSVPLYDAADLGRWGQLTCPTPCGTPSCTGPVYTPPLARSTASPFIAYFPTHQLCHDNKPSQQQEQQEQQEQQKQTVTTGTTGTISKKQCQKKKIPNEPRNQMSVSNECFVGWLFNSTAQMGANKTQRRCVFVLVVCWMDARFGNFASGGVVMPSFCAVASCIPPNKEHFRVSTRSGRGKCQKEQRKQQHNVHFPQLLTSLTQATACSHGFVDICDPCAGLGSGHKHPSRLCCK